MSKEKILEEFEKNVFGDCFAGGIFVDNEKQAMYTSGFKEGFNKAKNMSKQFLSQALNQTREETIREVEEMLDNYFEGLIVVPYPELTRDKIKKHLNKLKK